MLYLITETSQIESLLNRLKQQLIKNSSSPYRVYYRSQNNKRIPLNISIDNTGFWWGQVAVVEEGKLFNPFGLGAPEEDSEVVGDFEFNFSTIALSKKQSSQFGDDRQGNIFLLHNGHFSGRTTEDFDRHCRENNIFRTQVNTKDGRGYYVIANLRSADINKAIRRFIDNVVQFKQS